MEEIGAGSDIAGVMAEVGGRVRRARASRGMTLEGLSAASGVSVAHLSRLEGGGRQPSLATLLNVAAGLGVPVADLIEERKRPGIVVRGSESPFFEGHGVRFQTLTPEAGPAGIAAMKVVFTRDRGEETEHHRHEGEEWLYVISGRLRLTLGGEVVELEAGDAAYFDGMLEHSFDVLGYEEVEMLMVAGAVGGPGRSASTLHERHGMHEHGVHEHEGGGDG
ncbi:MAG: helix-turn-helix transcriptional regulator [Rubrobacter sp.]|nr:helix-turn-helix transcriptional regulator [Rubrobacter sp.]